MFDVDDDLFGETYTPSISLHINRPGKLINEHATLTIRGDAVEDLEEMLEFMTRALNAVGFTYVDGLRVDDGF